MPTYTLNPTGTAKQKKKKQKTRPTSPTTPLAGYYSAGGTSYWSPTGTFEGLTPAQKAQINAPQVQQQQMAADFNLGLPPPIGSQLPGGQTTTRGIQPVTGKKIGGLTQAISAGGPILDAFVQESMKQSGYDPSLSKSFGPQPRYTNPLTQAISLGGSALDNYLGGQGIQRQVTAPPVYISAPGGAPVPISQTAAMGLTPAYDETGRLRTDETGAELYQSAGPGAYPFYDPSAMNQMNAFMGMLGSLGVGDMSNLAPAFTMGPMGNFAFDPISTLLPPATPTATPSAGPTVPPLTPTEQPEITRHFTRREAPTANLAGRTLPGYQEPRLNQSRQPAVGRPIQMPAMPSPVIGGALGRPVGGSPNLLIALLEALGQGGTSLFSDMGFPNMGFDPNQRYDTLTGSYIPGMGRINI